MFRACIAAGIVQLVNVYLMVNTVSFLSSNSTEDLLLNAAEHAFGGCMHCVQVGVFSADIGWGICR